MQLGEVDRDPPPLIAREELGCRSLSRHILEIDIGELSPGAVGYDKQASNSSTEQGGGKRRSRDFAMRDKIRMFVVASDSFKSGRIVSHKPAGIPRRRPHDVGNQIVNVAHNVTP